LTFTLEEVVQLANGIGQAKIEIQSIHLGKPLGKLKKENVIRETSNLNISGHSYNFGDDNQAWEQFLENIKKLEQKVRQSLNLNVESSGSFESKNGNIKEKKL
jgi:hypothetical protein